LFSVDVHTHKTFYYVNNMYGHLNLVDKSNVLLYSSWLSQSITFQIVFLSSLGPATPAPVRLYIMPCICNNNRTFTNMTQDEIIAYLKQETQIQKNNTAKSIYKLKSRSDPRESSSFIGLIVTGVIGAFGFLIILSDMPRIVRHLNAVRNGKSLAEPLKKKK